MKQAAHTLTLATLLATSVNAQVTTITNDPSDPGVVTSYYSICPTASSTTITLDTTTTICPGPGCAGSTTVYVGPVPITTTGLDGRVTIYEEQMFTAPCPCDGGICDATYTITRECPCTAPAEPTSCPEGFTATAVTCDECAQNGGPSTVTVVTPVSSGPYASQTPAMGTPYNGASASAGASAYASAGPQGAVATAGSSAAASAGNGNDNPASGASSNAGANANTSNNSNGSGNSEANSESNANAAADNVADTPVAPAPAAPSRAYATGSMTSNDTGISPPIAPFEGSANRVVYAASAVVACAVGCLALVL